MKPVTFLDQTDEALGGAPITFLSPRSMPGAAGTLIKFLSVVAEPATGIVPVGSQATAQTINFGSSQTSQTLACALPPGCVAGDLAVLSCEAQNTRSFAWVAPTGAGTALAPTVFGSSAGQCAVYLYTLTQADVDAGSVGVPCTALAGSSVQATVEVDVRRGVSQTNIDVIGTLATGTLGASPASATAPGITTLRDGDLLQYCLFLDNGNVVNTVTPPAGWTSGEFPVLPGASFAITGYLAQSSAGVTGNVTPTVAYNTTAPDYAIVLLALRKKAPAITLSATFPSNLHVGDTGSFVVTATRVDGATGTLTITGSSLPDGMSIGSTTDNGDGTFTATATYDLTTQQDVTASFSATGGSVAATPLTHEFDVQAKASGPKQIILTSGTSWTVPSDWNNANNTVECISGGSGGGIGTTNAGHGGNYARVSNLTLSGTVNYAIGAGGAPSSTASTNRGGDTWFGSQTTVLASGGVIGSCVGTVTYAGGLVSGRGGGGAAGPNGAGNIGNTTNGGSADAGVGGAGGTSASPNGGNGTEWGTAGSGGGAYGAPGIASGNGGLYGGGGGGSSASGTAGAGGNGVIVITYTPA